MLSSEFSRGGRGCKNLRRTSMRKGNNPGIFDVRRVEARGGVNRHRWANRILVTVTVTVARHLFRYIVKYNALQRRASPGQAFRALFQYAHRKTALFCANLRFLLVMRCDVLAAVIRNTNIFLFPGIRLAGFVCRQSNYFFVGANLFALSIVCENNFAPVLNG